MGLDIRISRAKKRYCPHCNGEIDGEIVSSDSSGGRVWYDWLEKIGYYVPHEKRTEENDWYGKDMKLTAEQKIDLYDFVSTYCPHSTWNLAGMVAQALLENDDIIINADW